MKQDVKDLWDIDLRYKFITLAITEAQNRERSLSQSAPDLLLICYQSALYSEPLIGLNRSHEFWEQIGRGSALWSGSGADLLSILSL